MKYITIKIYAVNMDGVERFLGTVTTDNINRALQMYEDELNTDEPEELQYQEIIE